MVARFVPKDELGIFFLIQVIASFFVTLNNLLLQPISVTKFIADSEDFKKIQVATTSIHLNLFITITVSLIIFFCQPFLSHILKTDQLSRLFVYIPIFYLLSSFNGLFLGILQGFHQYNKIAISQVINGTLKFFLIIIFLVLFRMGIFGLIYAYLFSSVGSILFQYSVIPATRRFILNSKVFLEIFKFGFPLGLNGMLTFIFNKVDRIMIGAMINPIGVAYYEIASKIPNSGRQMYDSFYSVFFPSMSELFANKRHAEAETVLNNSLRLISFITIFAALTITLFQNDIVRVLFSERYLESSAALSVLTLSLSIALVGNILGTSLVALGQSDKPVKINIVDTVTNVIGNLVMIPYFGFMGAVYATLLSRCVTNPVNVWFLKKANVKVEVSQYLRPILAFCVCGILFQALKPESTIVKCSLIGLFLIICVVLSVIKNKDFALLAEAFRPSRAHLEK